MNRFSTVVGPSKDTNRGKRDCKGKTGKRCLDFSNNLLNFQQVPHKAPPDQCAQAAEGGGEEQDGPEEWADALPHPDSDPQDLGDHQEDSDSTEP